MPELPSYARRFFAKAFHETAGFTQRKLLLSAFMAVIVRSAFWGLVKFTQLGVGCGESCGATC
jgi:hypothetical protein